MPAVGRIAVCMATLAALLLGGCASLPPGTQGTAAPALPARSGAESQFDALVARQDRLYRVIGPLVVSNAVLCKTSARPLLGFTAKNKYSYPPEWRAAAESRHRLGEPLQVMQVLDGSGAMRAGLRRGDLLQSIEGQPLPAGPRAEAEAARIVAPLMKSNVELAVTVLRDGSTKVLTIPLTTGCAFAVDVGNAPHLNAYSDGRRIMVTAGMLDALTDTELASILAREMAHNVQRHPRTMQTSATVAGVIDALLAARPDLTAFAGSAGIRPMEARLDQEADRLALYLLARAGQDPGAALATLERLAQTHPGSVASSYTALHPWSEERVVLMRATLAEIRQKQAGRKPLVP